MAMLEVEKISCVNSAAFVQYFFVRYIDVNTGETHDTDHTGNYPVGQERTIDGADSGIPDGAIMWPRVHAVLGTTEDGDTKLKYAKNGQVATFRVTGTTLNFDVKKIS